MPPPTTLVPAPHFADAWPVRRPPTWKLVAWILASETREQSASTFTPTVWERLLETPAYHCFARSPSLVFATPVDGLSAAVSVPSSGPLAETNTDPLPTSITPPPTARVPGAHLANAPPSP